MSDTPTREDVYYYVEDSTGLRHMTRTLSEADTVLETWYPADLYDAEKARADAAEEALMKAQEASAAIIWGEDYEISRAYCEMVEIIDAALKGGEE